MQINLFLKDVQKEKKITYMSIKKKKKRSTFPYHNGKIVTIINKPIKVINEFFIRCHIFFTSCYNHFVLIVFFNLPITSF